MGKVSVDLTDNLKKRIKCQVPTGTAAESRMKTDFYKISGESFSPVKDRGSAFQAAACSSVIAAVAFSVALSTSGFASGFSDAELAPSFCLTESCQATNLVSSQKILEKTMLKGAITQPKKTKLAGQEHLSNSTNIASAIARGETSFKDFVVLTTGSTVSPGNSTSNSVPESVEFGLADTGETKPVQAQAGQFAVKAEINDKPLSHKAAAVKTQIAISLAVKPNLTKLQQPIEQTEIDNLFKIRLVGGLFVPEKKQIIFSPGQKKLVLSFFDDKDTKYVFGELEQIYSRNEQIVSWNQKTNTLSKQSFGTTELFLVSKHGFLIIPVTTKAPSSASLAVQEISVPKDLTNIDTSSLVPENSARIKSRATKKPKGGNDTAASVRDSDYDRQDQAALDENARSYYNDSELTYKDITLKFSEKRSHNASLNGSIYPAAGLNIQISGTDYAAKTDALGKLSVSDIPSNSDIIIRASDSEGYYRSTVYEVSTRRNGAQETEPELDIELQVLRSSIFEVYTQIVSVVQHHDYASICADAASLDEEQNIEGLSVSLDASADGPYYFNKYGYLDNNQTELSATGAFCFFNIDPGPNLIQFSDQREVIASHMVANFAGAHVQKTFEFSAQKNIRTKLVAVASAHEQLSSDKSLGKILRNVDVIDLVPFGHEDPLAYLDGGIVGLNASLFGDPDRLFAFGSASEFEPSVYSLSSTVEEGLTPVTPLIPTGFIEDMSFFAQMDFDSGLGSVMVRHADFVDPARGSVNFKLQDIQGNPVGQGWYYSDRPVSKGIFFNVPAGVYTLIVETADSYWLASKIVYVYDQTLSHVTTGSPLVFDEH